MAKRILVIGALLTVFAAALIVAMSILDVITVQELRTSLAKTVSVVAVTTTAVIIALAIAKIARNT